MTFKKFKELPIEIIFVTLYNLVQTGIVMYIFILAFPVGWFFGSFIVLVLTLNYFLLLKRKIAWKLLLIWYIIITLSFSLNSEAISLWFSINYGIDFTLSLTISETFQIGVDVIALIPLIVHYSARKHFKKKTAIDEIDDIAKNPDIQ
ncbi:hypothetical protein EZY14_004695 [Kordia sp. TARA_039_SRF]|nr:hypothetical protein EZY14_004695 [Kordia sp. TARA_039_SRF]